jgi:VanZ family protein
VKRIFRLKPEATLSAQAGSDKPEGTGERVASAFRRKVYLWGPAVLYMGVIFYVSAQQDVAIPSALTDKSSHSLAYTLLSVLIVRALAGGLPARISARTAFLGVVLTTLYGVSDEVHQMFVPGRSAEVYDLFADAIGGAIGAFACWLWGIISPSWPLKT